MCAMPCASSCSLVAYLTTDLESRAEGGGLRGEAGGVVSERCGCRQVVACAASAASRILHGQCAPGVPVPGVVHARQR